LAKVICSKEFRQQIEQRLVASDAAVRRRARWVLSAVSHNKVFHLNRGRKHFSLKHYCDAVGDCNRAILLDPACVRAFLLRGKTYIRLNQLDKAMDDFTQVIALCASPYVEKYSYKRVTYGDHLMWMPIRGKSFEAHQWLGWIHEKKGRYDLAIVQYSQAIEVGPDESYPYLGRARALYRLRQYERSIDDLNRCILLNPDEAATYHFRGMCYAAQNQFDWAIKEFIKAIELDPADSSTLIELSDAYFSIGNYEQARAAAAKAIDLKPEGAIGFCCRGKALFEVGEYRGALSDLSKSIEIDPSIRHGQHFYWRAKVYDKLGEPDLAARDREAALEKGFKPPAHEKET
jgi:tetratricopeptide (TPR) repeat protein